MSSLPSLHCLPIDGAVLKRSSRYTGEGDGWKRFEPELNTEVPEYMEEGVTAQLIPFTPLVRVETRVEVVPRERRLELGWDTNAVLGVSMMFCMMNDANNHKSTRHVAIALWDKIVHLMQSSDIRKLISLPAMQFFENDELEEVGVSSMNKNRLTSLQNAVRFSRGGSTGELQCLLYFYAKTDEYDAYLNEQSMVRRPPEEGPTPDRAARLKYDRAEAGGPSANSTGEPWHPWMRNVWLPLVEAASESIGTRFGRNNTQVYKRRTLERVSTLNRRAVSLTKAHVDNDDNVVLQSPLYLCMLILAVPELLLVSKNAKKFVYNRFQYNDRDAVVRAPSRQGTAGGSADPPDVIEL